MVFVNRAEIKRAKGTHLFEHHLYSWTTSESLDIRDAWNKHTNGEKMCDLYFRKKKLCCTLYGWMVDSCRTDSSLFRTKTTHIPFFTEWVRVIIGTKNTDRGKLLGIDIWLLVHCRLHHSQLPLYYITG